MGRLITLWMRYAVSMQRWKEYKGNLLFLLRLGQELSLYLAQPYGTVPIRNAETILTFGNYLNLTYLMWVFHHSSSAVRLPADEPTLASIMTHDHAKDLCASDRGPLRE